jgi:energy-coupling factor transporter ATP-binding protein EcfA2
MIEVEAVTFTYAGEASPALQQLDLKIGEGELWAVLGPTGAGKSTLCSLLAGFIPHFYRGALSGTVRVAGIDVPGSSLAVMSEHVGSVFQNPFNQVTGARYTVREEIGFGLENLGVPQPEMFERIERSLALTGLSELAERSPYALSGGQQQRLAIASILALRPSLMVLDEPTSQLDPAGTGQVFTLLRELVSAGETTVLVAEQRLEWVAQVADRCLVLQAGRKVAEGSPSEVLSRPEATGWGLCETRFSRAARSSAAAGIATLRQQLPHTLDQAVEYFQ